MRIRKIISQSRRDFTAVYECQHCEAAETSSGYDDAYFHNNVIPAMACKGCGKTGNEVTSSASIPAHVVL